MTSEPTTVPPEMRGSEDTFDRYARMVRRTLGVPTAMVTLVEEGRQVFLGAEGLPEPMATTRETTLSRSYCRFVVADRASLFAPDVRTEPRLRGNPLIEEHDVVAYAGWPLRDQYDRVVGSLCALDTERHPWSEDDRAMLEDLAAACSAEIAQRGLRSEALADERRARHLSERSRALLALSESLSTTRTLIDVAQALETTAHDELGCLHAGIWVRETDPDAPPPGPRPTPSGPPERLVHVDPGETGWGAARRYADVPVDATNPLGAVLLDGTPAFLATRADLDERYPRLVMDAWDGESRAWLPLRVQGETFGVLLLVWSEPGALSAEARTTILALAAYTAQAVQRARLLEDRLDALVTLQTAMTGPLPRSPGLALAGRYVPASTGDQVGGDWYDAVVLPDGGTAVMVGDVVGHDMDAAAAMGQLRSMLRTLTWVSDDGPSATVERLDCALDDFGLEAMATLLYAHVRPPRDAGGATTVHWSSAGHPPLLALTPDGSARYLDSEPDLLLGVHPLTVRSDHHVDVEAGTTLILFTDGLVERRGEDLEEGLERLRTSAERHAGLGLEPLLDALRRDLAGPRDADDVALLAVRVSGGSG